MSLKPNIRDTFNAGKIKSPVHLSGGNEETLIEIFKGIQPEDWVCGGWRAHYHCLLKGVPPDELKQAIIDGKSIALCFPEQRVICSAIVGGIIPIALGLAWAAKRSGKATERVWCFIGDMSACAGIATECARYARGHQLPLGIIVEDNKKSVVTDTSASWGMGVPDHMFGIHYHYDLAYPHVRLWPLGAYAMSDTLERELTYHDEALPCHDLAWPTGKGCVPWSRRWQPRHCHE